jgi:hypothetical protein
LLKLQEHSSYLYTAAFAKKLTRALQILGNASFCFALVKPCQQRRRPAHASVWHVFYKATQYLGS